MVSSKTLCRRQSILLLLDEPIPPCLVTESQCDNCIHPKPPTYRIVTDTVHDVLCFLRHSDPVGVFSLRRILAGLRVSFPICSPVLGILQQWPTDEICQFTDFLLQERYVEKKGIFVDGLPTYCLQLSLNSVNLLLLNDRPEIRFSVHESVTIKLFDGLTGVPSNRSHEPNKRRFAPKK